MCQPWVAKPLFMFEQKQDIDPIKITGLSEREKKVLELLRQDPTLTRAKMTEILGCSDATIKVVTPNKLLS